MRIGLAVTQPAILRHFETVILGLADRGHTVEIGAEKLEKLGRLPAELQNHQSISLVDCPSGRIENGDVVETVRAAQDYLRYLEKPLLSAPVLRERALSQFIKTVRNHEPGCSAKWLDRDLSAAFKRLGPVALEKIRAALKLAEGAFQPSAQALAWLDELKPDVLLVTPLILLGSNQAELVKAAQHRNIPVGFPVFSWDNLTTKGILHIVPDRVFVWNSTQRDEAVKFHNVPEERIVITGAPRFDAFFDMTPSASRAEYLGSFGLASSQPMLAYLCSSEFVARDETELVRQWIDRVRAEPHLRDCGIIIRPHPRNREPWREFRPPRGCAVDQPRSANGEQSLFDLLYHSVVVVALNTSAELEAGIVGRPVLTLAPPEFSGGQDGTVHFHYLLQEHGGFVERAQDLDHHVMQLRTALTGSEQSARIRRFVETFLRPAGLDIRATDVMINAFESWGETAR